MNKKSTTVANEVRIVKVIHTVMMVVFPVGIGPIIFIVLSALLHVLSRDVFTSTFSKIFCMIWIMYTYFMLSVVRNFYLRKIATVECNFDAYLDCMTYLERFYIGKKAMLGQKVNRTDAYLIKGDFQSAYNNLMSLKPEYEKFSIRTKMIFDYFWCKFYAELEDANNFLICKDFFQKNWVENEALRTTFKMQAQGLLDEMNFRGMIFTRQNESAKRVLTGMYTSGKLESKYEFFRYCYFMGKIEFSLANYGIAKHWFAQAVSFGFKEQMSEKAIKMLEKLDEMKVDYALVPPTNNTMNMKSRNLNLFSVFFSIGLGLALIFVFIFA